jgi:rhodanese-related sulfurtransferase
VAQFLKQEGFTTHLIKGGLFSWKKAGLETEPVPSEDVLLLPKWN